MSFSCSIALKLYQKCAPYYTVKMKNVHHLKGYSVGLGLICVKAISFSSPAGLTFLFSFLSAAIWTPALPSISLFSR